MAVSGSGAIARVLEWSVIARTEQMEIHQVSLQNTTVRAMDGDKKLVCDTYTKATIVGASRT